MDAPTTNGAGSIGDLFGRLADDGRAFVRAEAGLYKTIAKRRAGKAAGGAAALAAALFLVNAGLVTLVVCIALALVPMMGPLLAGLVTFAGTGLIAFVLVRYGMARMQALSGDAEERDALAAGEQLG